MLTLSERTDERQDAALALQADHAEEDRAPWSCPLCEDQRIVPQRGDYLLRLCSCVNSLPLQERALWVYQLRVANESRQQDRAAWARLSALRNRLYEEALRVLDARPDTDACAWLVPGSVFGTVVVDGLRFGLLLDESDLEGCASLALLTDGEPVRVESLEGLGAYLASATPFDTPYVPEWSTMDPQAARVEGWRVAA